MLSFAVAFYQSPDPFMAEHWTEIALVDYGFKLIISLGLFVPMYGVLLNYVVKKLTAVNPDFTKQRALTLSSYRNARLFPFLLG